LGFELPILIPNFEGEFLGWRPWHYEEKRKTQKATAVVGGPKRSGARVAGWKAEVFVPYDLLRPLQNVPPQTGTRWRANFYRVDYDDAKSMPTMDHMEIVDTVTTVLEMGRDSWIS
jgi:hypothetical protein